MSPRRLARNEARLVRCSAGCGLLVWLAGALPVAGDATFVCATCTTAAEAESLTSHCPHCWATDAVPLSSGLSCTNAWHHEVNRRARAEAS